MIKDKITSRLGEKLFFLIVLLYIVNTVFTGCKKEDHSEHDIPHDEVGVPYLPYAVYVADEEDESITVIDPTVNVKIGSIMISDHSNPSLMLIPHNVQVAPDGKTIWVTGTAHDSDGMEQVIVIDAVANHSIIKRINVGTNQHLAHVVLDSTSTYAYVTANESNEVIKIDAQTYTEVKRFNLNAAHSPHGLRYSGGNLYVANLEANSMSIINIATELVTEIPLGGKAVQTAVTRDGKYVFISLYDTKEVARYDIQAMQVMKIALPVGSQGPIQLYPTPDSELLYVCDQGMLGTDPVSNKVYVIDIATSIITDTIVTGYAAHGVVASNDGGKVYVTNSLSNTISVIDVLTQTVTNTITVGKAPNGISYRFPTGGMQ